GVLRLGRSVGGGERIERPAGIADTEPEPAGGENEARGEPLDIPLKRPRKGLVKVVDVENERAFRRREAAKVHQVTVAATLDSDAAGRRPSQVVRLNDGRAPKKCERRFSHAREPNRQESLDAALVRLLDQGQRVALLLTEDDVGMARTRAILPQRFARK